MGFEKGRDKTGGRLPGVQNQATRDIRAIAQGLIENPAYQASLKARLLEGSSPQLEVLLHYYAYGKPRQEIKIDTATTITVDRRPVVFPAVDVTPNSAPMAIEHHPDESPGPPISELHGDDKVLR